MTELQPFTKMSRVTVAVRCKVCGFKIRGPNHDEGAHHKKALARRQKMLLKGGG